MERSAPRVGVRASGCVCSSGRWRVGCDPETAAAWHVMYVCPCLMCRCPRWTGFQSQLCHSPACVPWGR
ncbi:lemur tyrosine kinase 3 [Homo sapiens]|uniref:Lemur tyrosine kinase 3 n=1 Tax=Homo sapiens TaxID=9606 RepID=A0A5F9ZHT0_HUMAN|nr:lemur tyrosine kinase 3 [Homo sapiens]KAI4043749.1 lemur tyrosine kinase 3 [Homo sapiens]